MPMRVINKSMSVVINLYGFFLEAYIAILDIIRIGTVDRNDTMGMTGLIVFFIKKP